METEHCDSYLVALSDECVLRLDIFKRLSRQLMADLLRSEVRAEEAYEGAPFEYEKSARALIDAIGEEASVAFFEELILQAKKSINRHAKWCREHGDVEEWDKNPPEWAVKYKDVGY